MAYNTVTLKNEHTGKTRTAPLGFSWTVFFFGWLPALLRGDWVGFLVLLLGSIPTFGLIYVWAWFGYNNWYARRLLDDGYTFSTAASVRNLPHWIK
jgi:hypothetical protein